MLPPLPRLIPTNEWGAVQHGISIIVKNSTTLPSYNISSWFLWGHQYTISFENWSYVQQGRDVELD